MIIIILSLYTDAHIFNLPHEDGTRDYVGLWLRDKVGGVEGERGNPPHDLRTHWEAWERKDSEENWHSTTVSLSLSWPYPTHPPTQQNPLLLYLPAAL